MKLLIIVLILACTACAKDLREFNVSHGGDKDVASSITSIEKELSLVQAKQWRNALDWYADHCMTKGLRFLAQIRGSNAKDIVVISYTLKEQSLRRIAADSEPARKVLLLKEADALAEETKAIMSTGKKRSPEELTPGDAKVN